MPQSVLHRAQKSISQEPPHALHPLTPPDTDDEYSRAHPRPTHQVNTSDQDTSVHLSANAAETLNPFHRKVSSMNYINSGPKEARERVIQRSLHWLVVVFPPHSFVREHGPFGHTLSSGAPHRISNGILMPLFPTMSGQLGAIAREFNLPSIVGLCLYLRTSMEGTWLSPRISEDSWHILWSHVFDARSPTTPQQSLPIGGQIEFDIDLAKARWYDVWLASTRRDAMDVPQSVPQSVAPSRAQSVSHWRGDSRTSILDETADANLDILSIQHTRPSSTPLRNVPKRLNLLDRFDGASVRSGSKLVPRNLSPPSPSDEAQLLRAISPVAQEESPRTARQHFDSRIQSWRSGAELSRTHTPLAAHGQPSLDPANLPNTIRDTDLPADAEVEVEEINLADYAWSVSSAGPPEYGWEWDDGASVASWDRVESVHLDRRLEGSVCLTPSVCTSFGPPDDDEWPSSVPSVSPLPSPDIARRMIDNAPLTASTATSWGPPSEYPATPLSAVSYAQSVDVGRRAMLSVPVTPATATSWGPPSYPPTPAELQFAERVPSPDLGARGFASGAPSPALVQAAPRTWVHVWPYTVWLEEQETATGPSQLVWPYNASPGVQAEPATPSSWVWPYVASTGVSREATTPSQWVFPYIGASSSNAQQYQQIEEVLYAEDVANDVPQAQPWPQVWPYAASKQSAHSAHSVLLDAYPTFNLYPALYPHFDVYPSSVVISDEYSRARTVPAKGYPHFNIYPVVYPHFDLYPAIISVQETNSSGSVANTTFSGYPWFNLYPAAYPHFDLYPAVISVRETNSIETVTSNAFGGYPGFNLYPAAYPYFDLYPADIYITTVATPRDSSVNIRLSSSYPTMELYRHVYPWNLDEIYPSVASNSAKLSSTRPMQQAEAPAMVVSNPYPLIRPYPPMYPYNLGNIYDPIVRAEHSETTQGVVVVHLPSHYPCLDIYSAVYPYNLFTIYPSITPNRVSSAQQPRIWSRGQEKARTQGSALIIPIKLPKGYPTLHLYSPVYPHSLEEIYPATSQGDLMLISPAESKSNDICSFVQYPIFDIYPAGYPWSLSSIYPSVEHIETSMSKQYPSEQPTALPAHYPAFKLYPSVYPSNLEEIYPASGPSTSHVSKSSASIQTSSRPFVSSSATVTLTGIYPIVYPYPPVYPFLTVYPEVAVLRAPVPNGCSASIGICYPQFEIYPSVYPFLDIYPAVWSGTERDGQRRPRRKTHDELHQQVSAEQVALPISTSSLAQRRAGRKTHEEVYLEVLAEDTTRVSLRDVAQRPATPAAPTAPGPLPRSRGRSGTVSSRPPAPPMPPLPMSVARPRPSPAVPEKRLSLSSGFGLPSSPAATRGFPQRPVSMAGRLPPALARLPASFAPMATLTEPESPVEPVARPPTSRPLPTVPQSLPTRTIVRQAPPPPPKPLGAGVSRSNTLSLPRTRPVLPPKRSSLSVDGGRPGSIPTTSEPLQITMSSLEAFPAPPPRPAAAPVSRARSGTVSRR
ncbi:hypothetical protein OBBRIDRAFT_789627 [Obba rivulosa]|uniref:Uncharacterized protein n=1 Tax=Obba rivulosa TaxID=1052685 RepID=A0A8E2J3U9_9APHY|nr:hypothetical protein OBBRIDRAFT_789627 [Obba rivulosa]